MNDVDRCLICGEVIPEGSQVCTACRNKYDIVTGETEEMAQELRDIADVLKITEGTDTNIRKSMESILRIADRLERTSNEVLQEEVDNIYHEAVKRQVAAAEDAQYQKRRKQRQRRKQASKGSRYHRKFF